MPSHEHHWVYTGDLLITLSEAQSHGDAELRRLEYCIECGAIRVQFGAKWWFWYSDVSKQFLSKFEGETHAVVPPPAGFKVAVPSSVQRLGRGLQELLKEAQSHGTSLKLLLGGKKGEPENGKGS